MKILVLVAAIALWCASCSTPASYTGNTYGPGYNNAAGDTMITQSLFADKNATISEENIQRLLNGTFSLPAKMRVAVLNIETPSRYFLWSDEDYMKLQQSYYERYSENLKKSNRVEKITLVPALISGRNPSITQIREIATRMQADAVIIFTTQSDVYYKYRLFTRTNVKAFSTTQLVLLDVRTGLIPYSDVITRDFTAERNRDDADVTETRQRALREAITLTIEESGKKLMDYLNKAN